MDPTKKRKLEENGVGAVVDGESFLNQLTPEDARKIIERLTNEQLLDILQSAVARHVDVLEAVRSVADSDPAQRKLFIRGLGWDTTTENLRALFSAYGELEEAIVILDKQTGKSKGYGFVTFRHVDGALLALKEPSKKIDGRVTVTQLAAAGNSGSNNSNSADVSMRKIYVANVPFDMPADKLLSHFLSYGEIEEGPLGFDKQTGKSRGFALFVYKTAEGAQTALVDPVKMLEGKQLQCKLAIEGKKGKPAAIPGQDGNAQGPVPGNVAGPGNVHGDGMGMAPHHGSYGGPGGMGTYGGYTGGPPPLGHHMNSSMPGQAPSSLGGAGGYGGSGLGGPYAGYGGPGSTGYSGLGGATGALGGAGGGLGGSGGGGGSGMYRMPPSSLPSGGYSESAHYSLSSSTAFPGQHHQGTGNSSQPRVPPGGMYPNVPPYY